MDLVLRSVADHVATLTLNHAEKRNALSRAMLQALRDQFAQIEADRQVRAVILRAEGPVFSSGHDLREMVGATEAAAAALFALCSDVMLGVQRLPQPVIAQVHGLATAAGCQLVASCDLVIAAEEASFATPGVKIGLFCTTPGVALVRAVTPKKALEMLLTGTPIGAHEAERIGLVNRVVPRERLAEATLQLARQICQASASVMALGKRAFYAQLPLACEQAYSVATPVMVGNSQQRDAQEGMRAFLEKRSPRWEQA
jgi:enoyl-CoA hydratase/carnithine racemase